MKNKAIENQIRKYKNFRAQRQLNRDLPSYRKSKNEESQTKIEIIKKYTLIFTSFLLNFRYRENDKEIDEADYNCNSGNTLNLFEVRKCSNERNYLLDDKKSQTGKNSQSELDNIDLENFYQHNLLEKLEKESDPKRNKERNNSLFNKDYKKIGVFHSRNSSFNYNIPSNSENEYGKDAKYN